MAETVKVKSQQEQDDERLLDALADLGGSRVADEDLVRTGNKLILPERWGPREAIKFLRQHIEQMEEETAFSRTFRYRPWDGANALQLALKRVFGTAGIGKPTWSFFGKNPPQMISIPDSPTTQQQVPWGAMSVPLFGGTLYTGVEQDAEFGPLFSLTVETQRRYKAHVEGLFEAVARELRENSIYKGHAIDGAENANFLDLRGVDRRGVVYSEEVTVQLEANVWSLLRHTAQMEEMSMPLKRAVLLEGPYGTGKTLAAFLTAQVAIENGWTFIYCRPAKDDLHQVMTTARLYQPAVVFFEDVDTIGSSGNSDRDNISRLLDTFDGITAKGTKLMAILTTNHKESIVKGMLRPGRLDALIHIGALDAAGVRRMIEVSVPEHLLGEMDFERVAEAMGIGTPDAFLPAFVKESIDRTVRYALARNGGVVGELSTEDFVHAATGLLPQLQLMNGAGEGTSPDSVGAAIRREVAASIDKTQVLRGGEPFGELMRPESIKA
jgi:transitional endoplasmic reticulum ATPase